VRCLTALALAILLSACATDSYPLLGTGASQANPVAVGSSVPAVVLYLQPRPDDRLELVSAEAIGSLDGADVRFFFSPSVTDGLGNHVIGERLEPLVGVVVPAAPAASDGPDRTVGIVAEVTPRRAGSFSITGVRLRLRINGGREEVRTGITTRLYVCAATPAPTDCGVPESP